MKVHRFFIKNDLLNYKKYDEFTLDEVNNKEQLHQIIKVLRLKKSEQISIFNELAECLTEILEIIDDKKHMSVRLIIKDITIVNQNIEQDQINLFMSFIKKNNFELIVEKCVELGVHSVIAIVSMRTEKENVLALSSDTARVRLGKIIIEATEQCGRRKLMQYKPDSTSTSLLPIKKEATQHVLNIFAHIGAKENINQVISTFKNKIEAQIEPLIINIYIGPEGGWHESEIDKMIQADFCPISLGSFVLRAETAAIVAIAQAEA